MKPGSFESPHKTLKTTLFKFLPSHRHVELWSGEKMAQGTGHGSKISPRKVTPSPRVGQGAGDGHFRDFFGYFW